MVSAGTKGCRPSFPHVPCSMDLYRAPSWLGTPTMRAGPRPDLLKGCLCPLSWDGAPCAPLSAALHTATEVGQVLPTYRLRNADSCPWPGRISRADVSLILRTEGPGADLGKPGPGWVKMPTLQVRTVLSCQSVSLIHCIKD